LKPPRGARLGALVDLGLLILAVGALLGGVVVLAIFGWEPPSTQIFIAGAAAAQMLVMLGAATILMMRRKEHWPALGLRRPESWNRTAQLVIGGYVAVVVLNGAIQLGAMRFTDLKPPDLSTFASIEGQPAQYLFWLAMVWSSAAIGEELLFRGFIWSRMERLIGGGRPAPVPTLVIQALLFGAAHLYQGPTGMLVTTGVGLVMGVVYLSGRRNLIPCILLHGLIDTGGRTMLFLGIEPPAS
jgi:uncharacterized protein